MTTLTKNQVKEYGWRKFDAYGTRHRIKAVVRFDDQCGNGHNTFSITGVIHAFRAGYWREDSVGCFHDQIAKNFPEIAPLIKWDLCTTDGPLHYIANTVHFAGDRDHWGLRKGERRQRRDGKTGQLCWKLDTDALRALADYVDADECPTEQVLVKYIPWEKIGEGKERELDRARACAVWPEATDKELTASDLKERLEARLPKLLSDFRAAVESIGFTW
jgi:hypothetical protein